MPDRVKEICENCNGTGRVVDDTQAGEPIATCMICKGNGWVYADQKQAKVNQGWLRSQQSNR